MSIAATLGVVAAKRIGKRLLSGAGARAAGSGLRGLAIAGLIGVLSTAAVGGYQQVRVWSRDAEIGRAERRVSELQASNAALAIDLAGLEAEVGSQNEAIQRVRQAAAAATAEANRRIALVRDTTTARKRAAATAGSGPDEMNGWMQEHFAPR